MLQELVEAVTQQLAKGRSPKRVVSELGLLGFNERDARRLVRTVVATLPRAGRSQPAAPRAGKARLNVALPTAGRPGLGRLATGLLLGGAGGTIAYACVHAGQPPYFLVIPTVAILAGIVESVLALRGLAAPPSAAPPGRAASRPRRVVN